MTKAGRWPLLRLLSKMLELGDWVEITHAWYPLTQGFTGQITWVYGQGEYEIRLDDITPRFHRITEKSIVKIPSPYELAIKVLGEDYFG